MTYTEGGEVAAVAASALASPLWRSDRLGGLCSRMGGGGGSWRGRERNGPKRLVLRRVRARRNLAQAVKRARGSLLGGTRYIDLVAGVVFACGLDSSGVQSGARKWETRCD